MKDYKYFTHTDHIETELRYIVDLKVEIFQLFDDSYTSVEVQLITISVLPTGFSEPMVGGP